MRTSGFIKTQNPSTGSTGTIASVSSTEPHYLPSRRTVPIISNEEIAPAVVRLTVRDAYITHHAQPAQFANLYTSDAQKLSPRPFGICDVSGDEVSFIFAVIGEGTKEFRDKKVGETIDILGPLGRPFDISQSGEYLLVGGGLGVPPLISAAQTLQSRDDAHATALFGYRNVHFADPYVARYTDEVMSIEDENGNVITLLDQWFEQHESAAASDVETSTGSSSDLRNITILSCGPMPMMKAVAHWAREHTIDAQMSLEARMGCGYGTCVVCVTPTTDGLKKVCLDGPMFTLDELGWE